MDTEAMTLKTQFRKKNLKKLGKHIGRSAREIDLRAFSLL